MAFASNTSAFGMKPATTSGLFGAAQPQQQQTTSFANAPPLGQSQPQQSGNLFGAFGQNQQQNQQQNQPQTGLFGQPQQQQPAGGLFGQPQQQQQQPGGSIFGQPQQQQQQPPAGNLFGQPQQQQQQQPGTGLFGQPQQQQQQPTGNLFGQPQQQQQQPTGSLFGQPQQQQSGGGLFGQPQQQQQQQQPAGGLFGGGSSLFGSTNVQQPQQQQQGSGLFGSTSANPLQAQATLPSGAFGGTGATTGAFGSTIFGTKPEQQQPQQQQQGFGGFNAFGGQNQNLAVSTQQPSGPPPFTKATKFNDLPDDVKKILENMDTFIQGRTQVGKELRQRKLGEEPTKGREAIRNLRKELASVGTTIRKDLHTSQDIKAKTQQALAEAVAARNIIDAFRFPQSGSTALKDHANFPLEYFTGVADQMKERLTWYIATIEQIERKLASATSPAHTPHSISATLQAQHATFLALASRTAAIHAELQKVKVYYTQLWRTQTGSVRDPFDLLAKSPETSADFGLHSLNVR